MSTNNRPDPDGVADDSVEVTTNAVTGTTTSSPGIRSAPFLRAVALPPGSNIIGSDRAITARVVRPTTTRTTAAAATTNITNTIESSTSAPVPGTGTVATTTVATNSIGAGSNHSSNSSNRNTIRGRNIHTIPERDLVLPTGEVMNAKNTLQSFDNVAVSARRHGVVPTVTSPHTVHSDTHTTSSNNTVHQHTVDSRRKVDPPDTLENNTSVVDVSVLAEPEPVVPTSAAPPINVSDIENNNNDDNHSIVDEDQNEVDSTNVTRSTFTNTTSMNTSSRTSNERINRNNRDATSTSTRNMINVQAFPVHSLIVAEAEAIDSTIKARESQQVDAQQHRPIPKKMFLLIFVTVLVVVITASVVATLCLTGKCSSTNKNEIMATNDNKTNNTTNFTTTEVMLTKEETITAYINNITLSGRRIMVNGTTPEDAALRWILTKDPVFNDTGSWSYLTLQDTSPSSLANTTKQQIRLIQRYALLTLWHQQHLSIRKWRYRQGWLSYTDECTWFGVACATINFGGVIGSLTALTSLTLSDNRMSGTIPADLGLLTSISNFNLYINNFTGTLSPSIGQWSSLTYFDVDTNGLSGTIPVSIGNWSKLGTAYLNNNRFRGRISNEICTVNPTARVIVECFMLVNCSCCEC